jgi:transportin-3
MPAWKDVLGTIVSTLGKDTGDCVLEFLRILPEEVREGRKINLSVRGVESSSACGQPTTATLPILRV